MVPQTLRDVSKSVTSVTGCHQGREELFVFAGRITLYSLQHQQNHYVCWNRPLWFFKNWSISLNIIVSLVSWSENQAQSLTLFRRKAESIVSRKSHCIITCRAIGRKAGVSTFIYENNCMYVCTWNSEKNGMLFTIAPHQDNCFNASV